MSKSKYLERKERSIFLKNQRANLENCLKNGMKSRDAALLVGVSRDVASYMARSLGIHQKPQGERRIAMEANRVTRQRRNIVKYYRGKPDPLAQ